MGKFEKVDTTYSFPDLEERILRFWEKEKVFEKSLEKQATKGEFVFYEGPPTANALPHPGHVLTRVIKDIIPRYRTMKGYHVARKAGWDTHGLPVEIEVEKELGFVSKQDIEKFGIKEFNARCLESVRKYEKEWRKISNRVGFWLDYDHAYFTFTNEYIESVWWILRQLWDKGLIYEDYKIVPYCYRCGTPLSSHEVAQNYRDTSDPSVYVKFKVNSDLTSFSADLTCCKVYFLVWTTTPWTLLSNVALAVNPDAEYVAVFHAGQYLILARELIGEVGLSEEPISATFSGSQLQGLEYEPLYSFFPTDKKGWYIIPADFVSLTEGTGIVHIAPAFGEEDYEVGKKFDLPFIQAVDEHGKFKDDVPTWAGMNVKEADPKIIADLKSRELLYHSTTYTHSYPFCWRCDSPLLYYAFNSWFIATTKVKDKLLSANNEINWIPPHIKEGRFGQWLEGVVDWALSRDRYWGTPLPIWVCENCGHKHCVGSFQELANLAGLMVKNFYDRDEFDPHRPFVDEITFACENCNGKMVRVPHVIDCWFDSGSMPFAQHHYPFENADLIDKGVQFPADFISEAVDQTRGWFYTLHAISVMLKDVPSYKTCLVLGHIQDERGRKMSKSLGNVVDPWIVINHQGADAFRWYFYSNTQPWVPTRFSERAVVKSLQGFLIPLWNVYSFFVIYANIDDFDPTAPKSPWHTRGELDRWILVKLNELVGFLNNALDEYKITESARALEDFLDKLSNWFVRRSRRRFWKAEKDKEKWDAYQTLYEVLTTLAKLIAPFTPFLAEELYQKLVRRFDDEVPVSVHLCDYPEEDAGVHDDELVFEMDAVLRVVKLGHSARNESKLKVRQPLPSITLVTSEQGLKDAISAHIGVILDELNIKELHFAENAEEFVSYEIKPNYAVLGPRLGALTAKVADALSRVNAKNLLAELEETNQVSLEIDGQTVVLKPEELDIRLRPKEGLVAHRDGNLLLLLNKEITPELKEEGLVREFTSRVQNLRKQMNLNYEDRIELYFKTEEPVRSAVLKHREYVCAETLAVKFEEDSSLDDTTKDTLTTEVEDVPTYIRIVRVGIGAESN